MTENAAKNEFGNPWVLAARPKTLPAGVSPVILGLALSKAYSSADISPLTAVITIACAALMQISSNLINDYYDGVGGLDDETRLGPPRAVALGLIPAKLMKQGFLFTLGLAFVLGLYLMIHGGAPIILIGLSSLFFAWAYTGGPFPLSHYALGEIFAFLYFGPIAVWGTWFLQTKIPFAQTPLEILLWGSAIGLPIAALMGVNNLRDIETDQGHKTTVAILLGETAMRKFVWLLLLAPQLLAYYLLYQRGHEFHLTYLIGPVPFFLFSKVWWGLLRYDRGRELNNTLATVGKYTFLFSLLYSILLVAGR